MDTLEDRIRDALAERAAHSPISPDAWDKTTARDNRPRRRWRWAGLPRSGILAPACAAAAIVAIALLAVGLAGSAPAGHGPGPASQPTPAASRVSCDGTGLVDCTQTVHVNQGTGKQATVSTYVFGHDRTGALTFCGFVNLRERDAPPIDGSLGGGGCRSATLSGALATEADPAFLNVNFGLAAPRIASAQAVLTDGTKIPGTVVSGRGTPFKVWQVAYPDQDPATVLFYDAAGQLVSTVFLPADDRDFSLPKNGGIRLFSTAASGTMTAYLDHGIITFETGRYTWEGGLPATGWPAVTGQLPDGSFWAGDECIGYVHPGVSRVVISLNNGYQTTVTAFTPGWPRSGIRLFAVALPPSFFAMRPGQQATVTQGTATAYNQAGQLIATDPLLTTSAP